MSVTTISVANIMRSETRTAHRISACAQTFVNTLVGIEKAQKGQATQAAAVTIANQQYYKASVTGKKTTNTYYCRKQDGYMVVIYTNGRIKNASALDSIVMNITTAQ